VAFGTISLIGGAECFFAVMASAAVFPLTKRSLGHLQVLLLHGEDFRVAIRAFVLGLVHVGLMAESDWAQIAGRGFKLNISSAHLFLLGVSHPESHEAKDTDADDCSFPNPLPQVFTPFPFWINIVATVGRSPQMR